MPYSRSLGRRLVGGLLLFALMLCTLNGPALAAEDAPDAAAHDVVILGATPGGIATALVSARLGHSVALVEYHRHVGGMTASGLSASDIIKRSTTAGVFNEFVDRVHRHYIDTYGADSEQVKLCRDGYWYEASVAERIFQQLLAEQPSITLYTGHRLRRVTKQGKRVTAIRVEDRDAKAKSLRTLVGKIFVDATYEGDLAAFAGAKCRVGRESRAEFNETHAGKIHLLHGKPGRLPGSTGEGDARLQGYTFRVVVSFDKNNRLPVARPANYDRERFTSYPVTRYPITIRRLPNNKADLNFSGLWRGYPFAGENAGYAEADWERREEITAHLRDLTLGLMYFLQTDETVPENVRDLANSMGLAKDEFPDNGHFPWQLYVREARRVEGEYLMTEHDCFSAAGRERAPAHFDAIATGSHPIDAMPTRKYDPQRKYQEGEELEGYLFMLYYGTRPYHIPYRAVLPRGVEGLLTPVPLSATHVAFGSLRMEPTWMAIGQACGAAAHLAITRETTLREVPIDDLQRLLLARGQVLTFFEDAEQCGPAHDAMQLLATRGAFADYHARPHAPLPRALAADWLAKTLTSARSPADKPRPAKQTAMPAVWADLAEKDAAHAAAAQLVAAGVLDKPSAGDKFRPDAPLTVAELSTWLRRSRGALPPSGARNQDAPGFPVAEWSNRAADKLTADAPVERGEACRAFDHLLRPSNR